MFTTLPPDIDLCTSVAEGVCKTSVLLVLSLITKEENKCASNQAFAPSGLRSSKSFTLLP